MACQLARAEACDTCLMSRNKCQQYKGRTVHGVDEVLVHTARYALKAGNDCNLVSTQAVSQIDRHTIPQVMYTANVLAHCHICRVNNMGFLCVCHSG